MMHGHMNVKQFLTRFHTG